jgi:hypothetical protein
MLDAPVKERFVFEHSGHRPSFEEPARLVEAMRQVQDAVQERRIEDPVSLSLAGASSGHETSDPV